MCLISIVVHIYISECYYVLCIRYELNSMMLGLHKCFICREYYYRLVLEMGIRLYDPS
jgi:hypothetical protein